MANKKQAKLKDRLTDYQKNQRDKKRRKRRLEKKILEGVPRDKNRKWL